MFIRRDVDFGLRARPLSPRMTSDEIPVDDLRKLSSGRYLSVAFRGLPPHFLAFELLSQRTLEAFLFPGLQIVGVFLDFLDNTFLLNLPLETPKGALNGFTFENPNFCQSMPPQNV